MKRLALVALLAVGCSSATVDPDNGVSNASYRQSVTKAEASLAAVVSRLERAQSRERTEDWWTAQIVDLKAVRDQLHMTLQGSTK